MRKSKKGINKPLFGPTKAELIEIARKKKDNPVIAIKTHVCEEKRDCPLCTFHPFYGVELVFIVRYADKTFQCVCAKCGKRLSQETGLKLPMTLPEIHYIEGAANRETIRKARLEMEMKYNEKVEDI